MGGPGAGCRGVWRGLGGSRGGPGRPEVLGGKRLKHEKTRKTLRYPLSVLRGGGKGEVKPPKCPTRHPRVGGYIYICIFLSLYCM